MNKVIIARAVFIYWKHTVKLVFMVDFGLCKSKRQHLHCVVEWPSDPQRESVRLFVFIWGPEMDRPTIHRLMSAGSEPMPFRNPRNKLSFRRKMDTFLLMQDFPHIFFFFLPSFLYPSNTNITIFESSTGVRVRWSPVPAQLSHSPPSFYFCLWVGRIV